MSLKITGLGTLSVLLDDEPLDKPIGLKGNAILIYVAMQNRPVRREQLAAMFWRDFSQERANANLRMTLMPVREYLGNYVTISWTEITVKCWLDVEILKTTLDELNPVINGTRQWTQNDANHLKRSLDLYQGDFLTDFCVADSEIFDSWATATRENIRRRFFEAAQALIGYYERIQNYAEGIQWCLRLLDFDPLDESLYRLLMRLYMFNGQRSLALREFEKCKQHLNHELGIEPDTETINLYRQINRENPVIQPDKLSAPARLPGRLTPLIGRESELYAITNLLSEARLITLVGTGGIGKTRLALELASRLHFPDGVFFADLSSLQTAGQVHDAVVKVLELVESQTLTAYLKNKKLLLVLDNFEHLLDAAVEVESWLKAAPNITIIATSREPLYLYSEYLYAVPPLSDDDAVTLFLKRVSAVKPGFTTSEDHLNLVKTLCEQLEGLPLALELAASRTRTLSLEDIHKGLEDRLRLLQSDFRGLPERQRTINGAIEWSYGLLTADEQRLYRRLSIFAGGWTLDAVESVCGELTIHLSALLDKNLIQLNEGEHPRYRMLETIRQHAAAQHIREGESTQTARTHLHYFVKFTDACAKGIRTPQIQNWLNLLKVEESNWQAALLFADTSGDYENLCQIAGHLGLFWYLQGYLNEGRSWIEKALMYKDQLSPALVAAVLASAGHIAHAQEDYQWADQCQSEALDYYRGLEDWENVAFMMQNMAMRETDPEVQIRLNEEAYLVAKKSGDAFTIANVANSYGNTLHHRGKYEAAKTIYEEVISIQTSHNVVHALLIFNLGCIYRDMQRFDDAITMFERTLQFFDKHTITFLLPSLFEEVGDLYYVQGDVQRAARSYEEGLAYADSMALNMQIRRLQRCMAWIAASHDDFQTMKVHYRAAYEGLESSVSFFEWISLSLGIYHIAVILTTVERFHEAAQLLGALQSICVSIQFHPGYIHRYFQNQALDVLRHNWDENQLREAIQRGYGIEMSDIFPLSLKLLEAFV